MSISSYRWTSDLYLLISRLLRYYLSACMFSMFLQFKYQLGYHDLVFCPHLSDSTFGPPLDNRLVFLKLASSLRTSELILPLFLKLVSSLRTSELILPLFSFILPSLPLGTPSSGPPDSRLDSRDQSAERRQLWFWTLLDLRLSSRPGPLHLSPQPRDSRITA